MLKIATSAAIVAAGLIGAAAAQAGAPPVAKIPLTQARMIALKAAPGKLVKSEYEKERGAWRYSFDIQQKGHIQEIGVDAMTGRIVENKNEGKKDRD